MLSDVVYRWQARRKISVKFPRFWTSVCQNSMFTLKSALKKTWINLKYRWWRELLGTWVQKYFTGDRWNLMTVRCTVYSPIKSYGITNLDLNKVKHSKNSESTSSNCRCDTKLSVHAVQPSCHRVTPKVHVGQVVHHKHLQWIEAILCLRTGFIKEAPNKSHCFN